MNNNNPITKAVFPIAGLGTRSLPGSMAIPKEMFPLVDVPILQVLVEQAAKVGVTLGLMITGRDKRALEDHFDRNANLEEVLKKKGKKAELKQVQDVWDLMRFAFARQPEPLGDGHALLQADPWIDSDESVFVLFGDTLCYNPKGKSSLEQMLAVYQATGAPVVLVSEVPDSELSKFGVAKCEANKFGLRIIDFVEKPTSRQEAPSNLVAVGQYIVTPELRKMLRKTGPGKDGEIRLAGALQEYMELGHPVYACQMEGEWQDTGDKLGYAKAFIRAALDHRVIGEGVRNYLQEMKEI